MHERLRRHARQPAMARAAALAGIGLLMVGSLACIEKVESSDSTPVPTRNADVAPGNEDLTADVAGQSLAGGPAVVTRFPGAETSFGPLPATPTAAGDGEPIRIGMINQEGTPLGSFPDVRLGALAAVEFINNELGGIDGRPLELIPCITTFSPEKSQACAQQLVQAGVVAVVGGLDITSNGSIPVLEQNDLAYVGGVPVNLEDMTSPISFQFSGGSPGAYVAFADHASLAGADNVVVAYGDFPPIKTAAVDYGAQVLRARGVTTVTELPFPITTTDFLPVLSKAAEGNPDAIFLAAADTACAPAMKTAHDLGIEAQLYLVGSCASPTIATQIGAAAVEGRIFNIEGPLDAPEDDIAGQLYIAAVGTYGDPALVAAGIGTVSFRSVMNLYSVLAEIGADDVSSATVLSTLRAARDRPSFNGHAYTCDGQQVPALPALCSPQQVLVQSDGSGLVQLTDWIDVPAIVAETGVGVAG